MDRLRNALILRRPPAFDIKRCINELCLPTHLTLPAAMSTKLNVRTISRFPGPSPGRPVASSASVPDTQFSMGHDVAPPGVQGSVSRHGPTNQPVNNDPPMPRTCRFAPFDEHLNELVRTPHWQKDLDDHFTTIFKRSVLLEYPIDAVVARALRIIGRPTQAKIRGLALAVCMHWMRMQFHCKDVNVSAPEIVTLISRITDHLGWMSARPHKDFLEELNYHCIEKLKLTWRWVRSGRILVITSSHSLIVRRRRDSRSIAHTSRKYVYASDGCRCDDRPPVP